MGARITSREGFVNDNLMSIGKRLHADYDVLNESGGENLRGEEKTATESARREAAKLLRELGDRVGRDSAAVTAELEQDAVRREELEKFRDFLDGIRSEMDAVDVTALSAMRKLEAIRYRIFTASGRAQAFFISAGGSAVGSDPAEPERKTWREIVRESFPLALTVLIGALLIGAAIFFALH